jgi:hypothetical protein
VWAGLWIAIPGSHLPLHYHKANPKMEALTELWFDAPDLPAQQKVAQDMQRLLFDDPPPSGHQRRIHAGDLQRFALGLAPVQRVHDVFALKQSLVDAATLPVRRYQRKVDPIPQAQGIPLRRIGRCSETQQTR